MLGKYVEQVRRKSPLIHNITNYVTVNDVANIILACGASPIMSDEVEEMEEVTSVCDGLNINIGTLQKNSIQSMFTAGKKANELHHALLLDPVGVGVSQLRTQTALGLMKKIDFDVIRGNISEIKTLANGSGTTKGVDANLADQITEENLEEMVDVVKEWSKQMHCILAITGAIDLVSDDKTCFVIRNGRKEMSQITGTGCQLSGMMTAYLASSSEHKLEAAAASVCAMGLAGEIGWEHMERYEGNATYRNRIIDAIYHMDEDILNKGANYEVR